MFEPDFEGCQFCGYAEEHHPIDSVLDNGTLCDSFILKDGEAAERQDTGSDHDE